MSMFNKAALVLVALLSALSGPARSDGIQNPGGPSTPVSVANGGTGDTGTAWATFTPSAIMRDRDLHREFRQVENDWQDDMGAT
jgi:hypothetical protein